MMMMIIIIIINIIINACETCFSFAALLSRKLSSQSWMTWFKRQFLTLSDSPQRYMSIRRTVMVTEDTMFLGFCKNRSCSRNQRMCNFNRFYMWTQSVLLRKMTPVWIFSLASNVWPEWAWLTDLTHHCALVSEQHHSLACCCCLKRAYSIECKKSA